MCPGHMQAYQADCVSRCPSALSRLPRQYRMPASRKQITAPAAETSVTTETRVPVDFALNTGFCVFTPLNPVWSGTDFDLLTLRPTMAWGTTVT
jgi:hypothetical protein